MATARLGAVSPWGLFLVLGLSASGRLAAEDKAMPANPQDALYLLTLENAVAGDRPLVLHLDCEGGKFTAGLGLTPRYNKNPHDVDLSGLKLDGNRVQGPVKVTIIADPWMPVDGKPVACAYDLDASLANGELSGTFKGQFGGKKVEGRITGTLRARPEVRNCRVKVWLGAALLRLWLGRGPNYKYALDMELTLPIRDGKVFEPKLESTVPDYRGYSAIVTKHDLKLEGHSLTGSLEVDVDYGGQGSVPKGGFDKEKHVFTLHGLVFGATVGGTYDIQVGELSAQGHRFIGALNSAPPRRRPRVSASSGCTTR